MLYICRMQNGDSFLLWLYAIGFFFTLGCAKNPPQVSGPEPDTRIWVRQAYDTFDYMKVILVFNKERAAILKRKYEEESDPVKKINAGLAYAQEELRAGEAAEAINVYNHLLSVITNNNIKLGAESRRNLLSMIGTSYLRYGEIENCVKEHNHQSCFIPIRGEGIHKHPRGSENAISAFEACLKEFPEDLEIKYLLNLAYMTLGQYPDKVPSEHRIDPSWFESSYKMQPFKDIAPDLGLNRNAHAGGVIIDDFTNDGWLDLVITSWSPKEDLIFYVNNGNGSFSDKTIEFGLEGQKGILHLNQTDYDNDGWLDMYLMRGAWLTSEGDIPNTLLRNTGQGRFEDVTLQAGLTKHAPGQAAAWSDFNLDGYLDLLIANESLPDQLRGIDLYMNQKDGSFKNEGNALGLTLNHYFKGCVAVDANNDRYPDIYLSSRTNGNFLFVNQMANGQNLFTHLPGVTNSPQKSFPCWNFDFDNDGNEDIFVSSYTNDGSPALHWMLSQQGKAEKDMLPKLYHNKGNLVFEEVGEKMGLDEVAFTMGCNFGDINTDGFLDFYLSTGNPQYQGIVPNKMYLNVEGKRFEDVSYSGGFANIQKGHGIAFGDLDRDGDEDLYAVIGGAFDGDVFYNCLFENPNEQTNNWVSLKLEGKSANKAAIGARVTVSVLEDGKERKIARTVTSGASFGANSLILEIGLRKSTKINEVTVQWPCKSCPDQTFTGIEINKAYKLTQDIPSPELLEYTSVPFRKNSSPHHMHQ